MRCAKMSETHAQDMRLTCSKSGGGTLFLCSCVTLNVAHCYFCGFVYSSILLQAAGGVEWRKKLDSQRGAVLATELKNNSCKIAKWATCAVLAGSSFIKFG